jgi:D-glycero-D-manno-heptose 1,7-bisphosphate phosphatase
LIEDVDRLTTVSQMNVLPGVREAIGRAKELGLLIFVVTNQPVVARGLLREDELRSLHNELGRLLETERGGIDGFYYCPHHPRADIGAYRNECDCRKPRPGLILSAAHEWGLHLPSSFLVGDRMSDVAAGHRAGCRSVLVTCGRHGDPPIQSPDGAYTGTPDAVCGDLREAVAWVAERIEGTASLVG